MAIVSAIVWSFIHVEELPAPPVTVTFFAAAAPPPPPPPPPARHTPKTPKPVVQPLSTPTEITQPKEEPEPEQDDDDGVEGGVEGGVKGGVVGGVVGGQPQQTAPEPPKLLPPNVAESQKLFYPMPNYTQAAKTAGIQGSVVAKICVSPTGNVSSVSILRGLPMMNDEVQNKVRQWRYKPFTFNGRAIPFCHVANFVFNLR
jgi:protein TonB